MPRDTKPAVENPLKSVPWSTLSKNPGYAGDIRWNRTINETNEIRDRSEWIIRPGHHPAIISKELFEQAQERFNKEYTPRNAKAFRSDQALALRASKMLRLWSVPFFLRSPQKVTTGYFLFPVLRILKRQMFH